MLRLMARGSSSSLVKRYLLFGDSEDLDVLDGFYQHRVKLRRTWTSRCLHLDLLMEGFSVAMTSYKTTHSGYVGLIHIIFSE